MSVNLDEGALREDWESLKNGWGWEYIVQTKDLSIDFIREWKDKFEDIHWDGIFLYQEHLNDKELKELIRAKYPHCFNLITAREQLSEEINELVFSRNSVRFLQERSKK